MSVNKRKNTTGYLKEKLIEYEKKVITEVYFANDKNQLKVAELLGINRNTLRSRLIEYGLLEVRPYHAKEEPTQQKPKTKVKKPSFSFVQ